MDPNARLDLFGYPTAQENEIERLVVKLKQLKKEGDDKKMTNKCNNCKQTDVKLVWCAECANRKEKTNAFLWEIKDYAQLLVVCMESKPMSTADTTYIKRQLKQALKNHESYISKAIIDSVKR